MVARFSTVAGERGSPDTWRDPRGFALKFYTSEGTFDLVGNNTPGRHAGREVLDDETRDRLVHNVIGHISKGVKEPVLSRVFEYWRNLDQ